MTTTTTPVLTAARLRAAGACSGQRRLFDEVFPDGAELTEANLALAIENDLDVDWCAALLDEPARAEYVRVTQPAWAEYIRVAQAAWAEYVRVTQPAWAEYIRVAQAAWAEYDRVTQAARAEYVRVTQAARAEYVRVTQAALLAGLIATLASQEA